MGLYVDSIYSMRWGILLFSICAILGMAYYGKDAFGGLTEGGFVPYNADSTIATTKLIATIGDPDYNDGGIIVLVDGSSLGWTVDMPQFQTEYEKVVVGFKSYKVRAVISYYEHPEQNRMVSDDRKKVLILGQPAGKPVLKDLLSAVSVSKLSVRIGGGLVAGIEMSEEILAGVKTAEFGTLPIIFILLCLTLGGLTVGLTPWIVAALSIFGTLSILLLLNMGFRISSVASNVVTMFGLGLGIDYSLFIVSRFCYERNKHPNLHVTKIIQRTLETSGRTVMFSAVTVVLSLSGGLIFHEFFLSSMCLSVMLAAGCASIGGVTSLLALLCIMDKNVFSCSTVWLTDMIYNALETVVIIVTREISNKVYPCAPGNATSEMTSPKPNDMNKNNNDNNNKNINSNNNNNSNNNDKNQNVKNSQDEFNSGFWYSIGTFVVDHPWPIVLLVSSFLISLTVVFFVYVQFGLTDPTVLHGASMARSVYSDIHSEFSKYGHSNIYVYLETPPGGVTSEKFLRALSTFDTSLRKHQGVVYTFSMINPGNYSYSLDQYISIYANARAPQNVNMTSFLVFPLALTDLKSHTYLEIALQYGPYTKQAKKFVSIVKTSLAESFPAGVLSDSGVAGRPAIVEDLYADLIGTIPYWISVMMISIFILLMIMTKSILIPIKAVVLSLLSLGATLGIIVLIFQKGGLQRQLDFVPNGYTDGSNLIFVFSVAFGLAVDYELFLIGQVQENYQILPDNKLAVTRALQQTGSVITSAAIMLALTTAAFLASTVSFIKLIGLGLAIAVIIDATVVRMFLVPATIVLFGDWNWWCPEPIKKAIDWLGVQETPDWLDKEDADGASCSADGGECVVVDAKSGTAQQRTGNTVMEFDNLEKSEEKKDTF